MTSTGDGEGAEGRPLDDEAVARRWEELTADLRDLGSFGDRAMRESFPEPRKPRPAPRPARDRPLGPRDHAEPSRAEELDDFVPEEPAQLSSADPVLAIGWVAAVAPLLAVLTLVVLASPTRPLVLTLGAISLFGVGLLLWRLPAHRHDDDDGAVL